MYRYKFILAIIFALVLINCNSSDEPEINTLSGVYFGTLKSDDVNKSSIIPKGEIIANVISKGDQLEVHCYGEELNITFMLEYFEHNDSIMVCLTGDDYENLYGHAHGEGMMSGTHNMQNGTTEWMQHLSNAHDPDEDHFFGGFDGNHHSFSCSFNWQDQIVTFSGSKQ